MAPTILVVDDEELVRAQIGASLEFDGFRIAQAANGSEAIDWLRHNTADVMLTDILMPTKGGIETIQDARRLHPDMKIIAMSGRVRTEAVDFLDVAQQFGAHGILFKPFGRTQLLALVRKLLSESNSI